MCASPSRQKHFEEAISGIRSASVTLMAMVADGGGFLLRRWMLKALVIRPVAAAAIDSQ